MKKIISFIAIALSVVGSIGGIGYACYGEGYVVAVGVAALAVLALPKVTELFHNLTD